MSELQLLTWMPLVPLLATAGVIATDKSPNVREAVTIIAGVILFALVVTLAANIDWDNPTTLVLAEPLPGLRLAFTPEPLGLLFALVASFLWPITTIYSIGYMRSHKEENQTRFYAAFAVSIAAVMGIALSANMLTLFLFYEILTLSTYPLVAHAGNDKARRAGRVYLGILIGTSVGFLLLAMIWTWHVAGTLTFTQGGVFSDEVSPVVLSVLLALYVFGTGKAAVMPFHRWLPAAMVAPTPVSALLHAVAVVKAGVFTILKVSVYIFGIDTIADLAVSDWLVGIAALTIVLASAIALRKDNFKARLAYSTVSQLSYITMGAMLGIAAGAIGGGLHIAMHAFGKITLFFCAGAVFVTAHKSKISELNGIGRRMPWTMGAFAIGAVSMIGVPPFAGFISKWYLVGGALQTEQWIAVGAIVISTLLNAAYFMPIVYAAFFKEEDPQHSHGEHGEAPLPIVLALTVTALATGLIFFFPGVPLTLVDQMVGG
ncbi:cation:proton antiporter [Solemya velesiana gill symbiont]|uniref:Cation:proton antiporter n=2 Tax=Solemya velesiana gill symbiont TaxID=1918948 RepID=A0A1T2KT38_9GAMM|nr:cation:proton antiporter [Solemya velesiana gill symbiont]